MFGENINTLEKFVWAVINELKKRGYHIIKEEKKRRVILGREYIQREIILEKENHKIKIEYENTDNVLWITDKRKIIFPEGNPFPIYINRDTYMRAIRTEKQFREIVKEIEEFQYLGWA